MPQNYKIIKYAIIISFFLFINLNAQTIQWQNTIGGNDTEWVNFIELTSDGNYITGGYSYSNISGDKTENSRGLNDFWLVKIDDTSGNLLWQKTIGGIGSDFLASAKETTDGGYILGGYSSSPISGEKTQISRGYDDYWVVKLDADRNIVWSKTYGGNGFDRLTSIIQTDDGGYLMGGSSDSNISGEKSENSRGDIDMWIIKIDASGNIIWQKTFGGSDKDWVQSMIKTPDGGYVLAGTSYSDISGDKTQKSRGLGDYWVLKINATGTIIWQKTIGGDNGDIAKSIVATSDGNYVIGGNSASTFSGEKNEKTINDSVDGWLVKLDDNGQLLWQKNIGGNTTESFEDMGTTSDNGLILGMMSYSGISGSKTEASRGNGDYWMVKLDSDGNFEWDKTIGGGTIDQTKSIIQGKDGGYVVAGWSQSNISGDKTENKSGLQDFWLVKIKVCNKNIPSSSNSFVCLGGTIELSATGGISYTWTGPNGFTSNVQNPSILNANATTIGQYKCDITEVGGCVSTKLVNVIINNQPLPTATSSQTFCIQQNATLNDITITGQNIKWYGQLTAGTLLSTTTLLQNDITYYASQTINGCESERIPVKINIQNTVAPTGIATQSFCTSQNPTLNNLVVVGTSIKWYDSATLGNLLTNTTSLVDGKTYYASQTINNCDSSNRLAITVSLISSLPANNYDFSVCDDLNDGIEYTKLEDFNSFLISNTFNYSFSYYKSLPDAENEVTNNKITNTSNYKLALGENKIYVRINSNTPCYAIAVLKISLFSKPIIPIQDIVPICENKSITINAGSGADSYSWSNGLTTQTIIIDSPVDLSVTATKNYGSLSCSSNKTFTVKASNIAKITSIETKDWTDNDNAITVFVTGSGDFEYSIDGINYQNSNQFSGINSGEYTVHVRDKNGCGTTTEEVYLLMYPKFFTPNGDGFNDTWKIKASDIEKELTIKIFDRFGKLLKELNSNSNDWDGTYSGQPLPSTDYWFVATRKNGKVYKGHFSLKR